MATDWVAANDATNPICPDSPTAWGYVKFGMSPKSPKAPTPPKAPKAPSPPKAPKPPKVPKAPQLSPPPPLGGGNTFLVDNFPFFASCSVRDTNLRPPYRASTPTGPLNVTSTTATYCFHLVATNSSGSPCAGMSINRLEFIVNSTCVNEEPKALRAATINGTSVYPLFSPKTWKGELYGMMTFRRLSDIFPTIPSGGLYICLELGRTSRCSTPAGLCYGHSSCVFAISDRDFTCCATSQAPVS
ncbi:hypothetical protein VOLCADRAFT_100843 [Volvox carteri f. nagariensis]|uniref:Pherophorin domain-containing protein n=1 Tax=Volvox carteri f. nagariensis TaxID=3068 RepID=D8UL61_VOLCA|nr:uncharacterized protein VOLCADRAFT_100843 [Volvox carteri f. nagariensis]EFJ39538.1 hypothetical protein VOLCADRAFT_100843 [Volvox carteri f. nagariensis]|eukprot:XP_002959397.1 hypothetical protein VOLCADRAFT_100843 [Volvox carteri f. nagariensis]